MSMKSDYTNVRIEKSVIILWFIFVGKGGSYLFLEEIKSQTTLESADAVVWGMWCEEIVFTG